KALRQQQREEAAARQRGRDRRNLFIIGGILGTAAVAILIVALALNHAARVSNQNRLPFQTVSGTVGTAVTDEDRNHGHPSPTPPTAGGCRRKSRWSPGTTSSSWTRTIRPRSPVSTRTTSTTGPSRFPSGRLQSRARGRYIYVCHRCHQRKTVSGVGGRPNR